MRRRGWRHSIVKRKHVRIALFAVSLGVLAIGAIFAYGRSGSAAALTNAGHAIALGDITETVTATGTLQPKNSVDVGAQVSGQLKAIHVEIGQNVSVGDLLAEIDPTIMKTKVEASRGQLAALRAQLRDRQSQARLSEIIFERQERLKRLRATSDESYESADASVRSSLAQVDMVQAQITQVESSLRGEEAMLDYTNIRAPISGTIVSLPARAGQTVIASQQAPLLMRISDLSTMTVLTQVSEADVPFLRIGQRGQFSTLGRPGRQWSGALRQVLPTPEVVNSVVLYTALFDVSNHSQELLPQMTAQVIFIVGESKNVPLIPKSAIVRKGRANMVLVDRREMGTEVREVSIGRQDREHAEVTRGVAVGERVINRPTLSDR